MTDFDNIPGVVPCYSHEVMANETDHFARTPKDQPFQKFVWQKTA